MSKKPRFFCEHCGAEVLRNSKRCLSCGRLFASVLCPKCGFSGAEELFSGGCPSCGYSAPPSRPPPRRVPASDDRTYRSAPSLPFWVYALTVSILFLVIAAAFVLLR